MGQIKDCLQVLKGKRAGMWGYGYVSTDDLLWHRTETLNMHSVTGHYSKVTQNVWVNVSWSRA